MKSVSFALASLVTLVVSALVSNQPDCENNAKGNHCRPRPPAVTDGQVDVKRQAEFKADIRVDTNRDGVVDVDGSSDLEGKNTWTETSGAIFIANIGDSGGRCKQQDEFKDAKTPIKVLSQCHDASDDTQRAPQYMAPMRTMPMLSLSDSATARVHISPDHLAGKARIFRANGDSGWDMVKNDTIFSANDVRQGLKLGIDGTFPALDWNGLLSVVFEVEDGGTSSNDTAMLRLAPVMFHHNLQPIQELFISSFPTDREKPGAMEREADVNKLLKDIAEAMHKANVSAPITKINTGDIWTQDYFEPGYTSMPGPNGTVISLRVIIEARPGYRDALRHIYTELRGDGVGALSVEDWVTFYGANSWLKLDAGGDIETIPPHESNGKKWPGGRTVVGGGPDLVETFAWHDLDYFMHDQRINFKDQEQPSANLDSSWLVVPHIDLMIQFIPAKTERRWSVMAIDAQLGVNMLRDAQKDGHGGQQIVSHVRNQKNLTIDEFLANEVNLLAAKRANKKMGEALESLKYETGITDAEIFRVPALVGKGEDVLTMSFGGNPRTNDAIIANSAFSSPSGKFVNAELETCQFTCQSQVRLNFYLPCPVNGVPLADSHYLAPKQFGPIINGHDVFEDAVRAVYERAGLTADFIDIVRWHQAQGGIHCLTNTFRDTSTPWWG